MTRRTFEHLTVISTATLLGFLFTWVIYKFHPSGFLGYSLGATGDTKTLPVFSVYWSLFDPNDFGSLGTKYLLQSLVFGGIAYFTYLLATRFFPHLRLHAFLLCCVTPNLVLRIPMPSAMLLFTFFILVGTYFTVRFAETENTNYGLLAGIFLAITTLTRPSSVFIGLFVFVSLIISFLYSHHWHGLSKALTRSILPISFVCLSISCVVLMNHQHHGKAMYSHQSGSQALYWTYPCLSAPTGCGSRPTSALNAARSIYNEKAQALGKAPTPPEQNSLETTIAIKLLLAVPLQTLISSSTISWIKLATYSSLPEIVYRFTGNHISIHTIYGAFHNGYRPNNHLQLFALTVIAMSYVINVLFLFFSLYGLYLSFKSPKTFGPALIIFSMTMALLLAHIGMGNPRYRTYIEPFLILFFLGGFSSFLKALKNKTRVK